MTTPSDLFLSPDLSEEDAREYLRTLGFRDAQATDRYFQAMAEDMASREAMGRVAGELLPALLEAPDPDAAVAGLAHYLAARTGRGMFLDYLAEDPRAMHVLACVFGSSPMLSEILVRHPEYFHWLVSQVERSAPERRDLEEELDAMLANVHEPAEAVGVLGRWQHRELLRIATRDLLRRETIPAVTAQLTDLASVAIDRAMTIVAGNMLHVESRDAPGTLAVIGLGSLGSRELSYSPDLELLFVFESPAAADAAFFERLCIGVIQALNGDNGDNDEAMYRVRGSAHQFDDYVGRLHATGGLTERMQLIQARPVAGDQELGARFVKALSGFVFEAAPDLGAIGVRSREEGRAEAAGAPQVERVTQLFHLAHGAEHPGLHQAGTLAALDSLAARGLVPEAVKRELSQAYIFLRTVEHRLQLVHDHQTGLGSSEDLEKQLAACRRRVAELSALLMQPFLNG